jgi:hypothetical protein
LVNEPDIHCSPEAYIQPKVEDLWFTWDANRAEFFTSENVSDFFRSADVDERGVMCWWAAPGAFDQRMLYFDDMLEKDAELHEVGAACRTAWVSTNRDLLITSNCFVSGHEKFGGRHTMATGLEVTGERAKTLELLRWFIHMTQKRETLLEQFSTYARFGRYSVSSDSVQV